MTVEIEDIRGWVDAELVEPRAEAVARAVKSNEFLQHAANKLRASRLPYRQAYESVQVPDVPESLRIKIAALQEREQAQDPVAGNPDVPNLPVNAENDSWFQLFGIAACMLIVVLVGYLAGANTAMRGVPAASISVDALMHRENFARTVAAYQKFYTRDTLNGIEPPDTARVAKRLAKQTGMQVIIPQLDGYEFIRAQRLSFGGELLLQLVYLGAEGRPLALCYMPALQHEARNRNSDGTDRPVLTKHHGLNTAEWRNNSHRFVIVSDASENKLQELSLSTRQQWNE